MLDFSESNDVASLSVNKQFNVQWIIVLISQNKRPIAIPLIKYDKLCVHKCNRDLMFKLL